MIVRIEQKNGITHEYTINGITTGWQKFVVPFSSFSAQDDFLASQIKHVLFVLDDVLAQVVTGTYCVNDLMLTNDVAQDVVEKKRSAFAYEVEGAFPLGTNKSFFPVPEKAKGVH